MPICFMALSMSPDITPCIICLAWLKSLMNLLTSTKLLPEPAAIRRRRLGLSKSGFSRSSGVIDDTMARFRAISFSSTLKFFMAGLLAIPGIILIKSSIGPMLCIWSNCSMKSLKSKVFSRIFSASSNDFLSSYSWLAFSISVNKSPIPRIRLDIRSGWKVSISVIFSPVPVNLIGLPVISRIESAAPPRVSPSILVKTTPVISNCLLNSSATLAAS